MRFGLALEVVAPYVAGLALDAVAGGWRAGAAPSAPAVPTWVDAVALLAWAIAIGVTGGQRRTAGLVGHVVGVAIVAGTTTVPTPSTLRW